MAQEIKITTEANSKESEMIVLGCMLKKMEFLKIASQELTDADFYYNEHKTIFQVLQNAYSQDKFDDIHLIFKELRKQNKLKYVADIVYISTLAQYAVTSAYFLVYCEELKKLTMKRQLIYLRDLLTKDLEKEKNVNKIIDRLKDSIQKIENKIELDLSLLPKKKKPLEQETINN